MGRHRRSAAGRAATGRVTEVAAAQGAPAEYYGPENLYGFAAVLEADTPQGRRSHRKQKKTVTPVRTGLLGVSAAVAISTVAVATGVLPGGDSYNVSGGNSSDTVLPAGSPSGLPTQQGGAGSAAAGEQHTEEEAASHDGERAPTSPAPTSQPATPTPTPSQEASAPEPEKTEIPAEKETKEPAPEAPVGISAEAQAEAEVLRLVNVERARAGCAPVAANSALAKLAEAFSKDMALRDFFDHIDPDGSDPWNRASVLGIVGLGGENIARGQTTAEAVMQAWMDSPGHRANILNCDFTTLGVGVHLGAGGPWWTQDFGY